MNIFLLGATPRISSEPGEDSISKLAKTGGNTGNQVIAYGLLSQIKYQKVAWDYRIDPQQVREQFDMIVIAAANFLFPAFDLGGMADYIERVNLPVAIVGLGAQSNNYDPNIELLPGTERFVKVLAERAVSIGVRGPYTQAVLAHRGVHNVTVTGCPSFYMSGAEGIRLTKRDFTEVQRISVNASRDVLVHSFNKDRMRRLVVEIYSMAVNRNADFVAQSERSEIKIADQPGDPDAKSVDEVVSFLAGSVPEEQVRAWAAPHIRAFFDVDEWLTAIRTYDFVLGTRFHGAMVALQRGVPAVVICHDTRTEDMCRFLSVPHVSILKLDNIDIERLYGLVEPSEVLTRSVELYAKYSAFLRQNGLLPQSV